MLVSSEKCVGPSAFLHLNFWSTKADSGSRDSLQEIGQRRGGCVGAKEIILQEMKTRLSQKLQKTNSPKMTHEDVHMNTQIPGNTKTYAHRYVKKYKHTHTHAHPWVAFLMPVVVCNWHWEFSLCLSTSFTHTQKETHTHTHGCTHRLLLFLAVGLDWFQMDQ